MNKFKFQLICFVIRLRKKKKSSEKHNKFPNY